MADALALELPAGPPGTYRQRSAAFLQRLFRTHFPEFAAHYDAHYARRLGRSRLPRINKAVERFLDCGDCSKSVARIHCTNPDCRAEHSRLFSCKVFQLCPSCFQKRSLLFGEYMNERLLLRLPHLQMVFTFTKVLRAFFRHHRSLYGEIAQQLYAMITRFYNAVASCKLHSAAVIGQALRGGVRAVQSSAIPAQQELPRSLLEANSLTCTPWCWRAASILPHDAVGPFGVQRRWLRAHSRRLFKNP